MNKSAFYPIIFLCLLGATGIKQYEHSYHTGGVTLMKIEEGQTIHHTKCQLDYTIINDSMIERRFQILNLPTDWNVAPEFTFHGVITRTNSPITFGRGVTRVQTEREPAHPVIFEWESNCSFENTQGNIQFAKEKGKEQFYGRLANGIELSFHLE
jgi:hypothetical protein